MPVTSLLVIAGTIVILALLATIVMSRAGVVQLGGFTVRKYQEGQSIMHNMDEENADADDLLKQRLRQMTNSLRTRIVNMFSDCGTCLMTRRALSSSLRFPLYESIGNNHFTKELMPSSFPDYRQRILEALEDEYIDIRTAYLDSKCEASHSENSVGLPEWEDASKRIEQFLDTWLRDLANHVNDCCLQKIDNYHKYLEMFEVNKDTFRISITKDCAKKNEHYSSELVRLSTQLAKDIRQREELL